MAGAKRQQVLSLTSRSCREADVEIAEGEVRVLAEGMRRDREILSSRLAEFEERRKREEIQWKEGKDGVEKEIELWREKVSLVESMKNAIRGREAQIDNNEGELERKENEIETAQERLKRREEMIEGKERSIMVRLDEQERRKEGEDERIREKIEELARREAEVDVRGREVGGKEVAVKERER